jgi:hypothetical protein
MELPFCWFWTRYSLEIFAAARNCVKRLTFWGHDAAHTASLVRRYA